MTKQDAAKVLLDAGWWLEDIQFVLGRPTLGEMMEERQPVALNRTDWRQSRINTYLSGKGMDSRLILSNQERQLEDI